jgi:CBS domain-containing protein
MAAKARERVPGTPLQLRTLHIAFGDGHVVDRCTVRCPRRDRTATVEECVRCEGCASVVHERRARTDRVLCRYARAQDAFPPRASAGIAPHAPVATAMTTDVVAVSPDVSMEHAAALLLERGIGGAPVVDAEGRPLGMLSKTDVMAEWFTGGAGAGAEGAPAMTHGRYRLEVGPGVHVEDLARFTVEDAMTHGVLTLPERAPVTEAAAKLALYGIHRLPVVSERGSVVGIVTCSDIARWVARWSGTLATA